MFTFSFGHLTAKDCIRTNTWINYRDGKSFFFIKIFFFIFLDRYYIKNFMSIWNWKDTKLNFLCDRPADSLLGEGGGGVGINRDYIDFGKLKICIMCLVSQKTWRVQPYKLPFTLLLAYLQTQREYNGSTVSAKSDKQSPLTTQQNIYINHTTECEFAS